MTDPPSTHRPTVADELRNLVLTGVVGLAIGLFLWIAESARGALAPQLVSSVWVAFWIYGLCRFGVWLFHRPLERLGSVARRLALGAIFFVAGGVAWAASMTTLHYATFGWLVWTPDASLEAWVQRIAFTGLLGVALGLTFASFEVLQERLRQSVARLKEQEFALRELATAREIQQRLLPPPEIDFPGYRVSARSEPAQVVAGDFYDAFSLPDGSLAVTVGDVAGKGMGASLLMASVKAMLPLVAMGRSAAETLRELNRRLAGDLGKRQFVALAFARIEPATGRFQLANAGLPDPYLARWSQRGKPGDAAVVLRELVVPGPRLPLGVRREVGYLELGGQLVPGERLLMVSDGLPEAATGPEEVLGYDGLEDLLTAGAWDGGRGRRVEGRRSSAAGSWLDALFRQLDGLGGPGRLDDWTALVIEREGDSGGPLGETVDRVEIDGKGGS